MKKSLVIAAEVAALIAVWFVIKYAVGKPEITTESIMGFLMYMGACAACIFFYYRNSGKKDGQD